MKKLVILFATLLAKTAFATSMAVVVPFGPGGSSDILARSLVTGLPSGEYHVLNMPGGKGIPAIQYIINNQTVMVASLVQYYVSNPLTVNTLPYNINNDVDIIGAIGVVPNVLLCNNKKVPVKNFKELSSFNRSLNIGVSAIGGQEHIAVEIIGKKLSTSPQVVMYSQGGVSYMPDLIAGNIDCIAGLYPAIKSHLSNPTLTAIISTHQIEDVNDSWESVFKTAFPLQGVSGLLVNKNISNAIRANIIFNLNNLFKQDLFKQQLKDQGYIPIVSTDPKVLKDIIQKQQAIQEFLIKNQIKLQQ